MYLVPIGCYDINMNNTGGTILPTTISETNDLNTRVQQDAQLPISFNDIIGNNQAIIENKLIAKKIALTDYPILIQGETGTGKYLFAKAIHNFSTRKNKPFITVDCNEQDEDYLELTLFGTIDESSQSLIEKANGGTLYFKNIGELPKRLQTRLINVLEQKQLRKSSHHAKLIPLNIRFISSSSSSLHDALDFRKDLLYRLNVLTINLTEIKDMKQDIPLFVNHFLNEINQSIRLDQAVMDVLCQYHWPGNFREIKNAVKYMVTVCDGRSIQLHDLPQFLNKLKQDHQQKKKKTNQTGPLQLTMMEKLEYAFILEEIKQQNEKGEPASRRSISENSKSLATPLTTQQVRHRLDYLEKKQYITKGRGRAGTRITLEGLDFLLSLKEKIK